MSDSHLVTGLCSNVISSSRYSTSVVEQAGSAGTFTLETFKEEPFTKMWGPTRDRVVAPEQWVVRLGRGGLQLSDSPALGNSERSDQEGKYSGITLLPSSLLLGGPVGQTHLQLEGKEGSLLV